MKWSRVKLGLSILTAAGLWQTVRERIAFAPSSGRRAAKEDRADGHSGALPTHYDLAGAVHVHSSYSDGTGTVAEIACAGVLAGVDFVLLTDHSTLAAAQTGEEGWHADGKLLVVVAVEISTDTGHLLLLEIPPTFDVEPAGAAGLMNDAAEAGGFGYIALPLDLKDHWRDFETRRDGFGLEVFNLSSIARTKISIPGLLLTLARYAGKRPISAFSYVSGRPEAELRLWDRLCAEAVRSGRPIPNAIGSIDAHAVLRFGGKTYPYPTYEEVFRTLRTHVLVSERPSRSNDGDQRDLKLVNDALRFGHSYISYDNYGDPRGFSFELRTEKESVAIMGDSYELDARWPVSIDVRSPNRRSIIRLLRNGKACAKARSARLRYLVRTPGVYRVEVTNYRWRLGPICFGAQPWIFSNPIDVRPPAAQ